MIEKEPIEISRVAKWNYLNTETLRKQYKNHLSDFNKWGQKEHATDWMIFPKNLDSRLSIDEVAMSNGELYIVVTKKSAHGRKGSILAMVKGTKSVDVSKIIRKIPIDERMKVKEVTLDMANSMDWIVRECFMNAVKITDRFHVQKLVSEAIQQMRIKERWAAIDEENELIKESKQKKTQYVAFKYMNGETKKQLLARSRYLLFKPRSKWSKSQSERAEILFNSFPELKKGYELSMMFRGFYQYSKTRNEGRKRLKTWYEKVEKSELITLKTAMKSVQSHEGTILNYFPTRSTNAAAESFNSKLKGFRALVRGVTDLTFFLFRISKFFA